MKAKLISRFILLFSTVAIFFIIFQTYSIRTIAINSATSEATRISQLVKDGLTAHMVNGTMDKRDTFINSATSLKGIESLWIIRGNKVIREYGIGRKNEQPQDNIDKQVLASGKAITVLNDKLFSNTSNMRITIPYKATSNSQINCFECHNVNNGDVLGAISIKLDMSHTKQMEKELLYLILIATIILIFLIIIIVNAILKPYIKTFERIAFNVKESQNGTFSNIMKPQGLTKGKEADILINNYNNFINELQLSFNTIDHKLRNFTGTNVNLTTNSFLNTNLIINNLSDIYNFKKQIEIDTTAKEIYSRLSQILINKFNITQFSFVLYDTINKTNQVIWMQGKDTQECNNTEDFNLCRAYKISQDVHSIDDHKVCDCFNDSKNRLHYCLPFKIMDNTTLVIKLLVDTKDELNNLVNTNIQFIKKYLEEAIPALKIKYIMEELNQSLYRDSLTSLYNRKFFDEEIDILITLATRENFNIAVLMLDMDHFKAVNDEHGHAVGDQVLKMFANVIKDSIRDSDIAIRMGGEEFLVLLMNTSEEDALIIANKLRNNVAKSSVKLDNGDSFYKTISTGVSMFPEDSNDIHQVVINSDIGLYVAKDSGRNKVIRWEKNQTSPIEIF